MPLSMKKPHELQDIREEQNTDDDVLALDISKETNLQNGLTNHAFHHNEHEKDHNLKHHVKVRSMTADSSVLAEFFPDCSASYDPITKNGSNSFLSNTKDKPEHKLEHHHGKRRTTADSSTLAEFFPDCSVSYDGSCRDRSISYLSSGKEQPQESIEMPEDDTKGSHVKQLLAGVILALMSALCFSITTVIVKFATDVKPSMMALFRYVGILVLSYPVVVESKEPWYGDNNWWWRLWMLCRGLSGCTSLFFRYNALTFISLTDTTIIMLAMPVFVFIFARIFLKEPFGRYHVLALVLSIVGIAFASQIEIFFQGSEAEESVNGTSILAELTTSLYYNAISTTQAPESDDDGMSSTAKQLIGSLFALGAMAIGSLVYIFVRKMRKTHHAVILFNFGIIAIVEMALINLIFYDFHLPTSGYSAYLVPILATFSFYGQLLLTKAIQIEEPGVVSVVRVSGEAFFAFVFQIAIFHEMPNLFTILGAILVLSAVFLLAFRKYIIALPDDAPLKKRFYFLTK